MVKDAGKLHTVPPARAMLLERHDKADSYNCWGWWHSAGAWRWPGSKGRIVMSRELTRLVSVLLVALLAACAHAQLPAGWTGADVGGSTPAGSVKYQSATETWTLQGDGKGIRGSSDQFYFVYKTLSGDGELVARVASLDPLLADWSMAGVMIRVFLVPGSPYLFMGVSANTVTQDHGITFWGRENLNGAADQVSAGAVSAPYWVKVKRAGSTFSASASSNGRDWTEVYSTSVAGIPKVTYIGYAVTSEVAGKLITAVFDKGPVKVSEPNPADKAIHVAVPLLQWTAGVTAVSHNVYFGTNPTPGQAEFAANTPMQQTAYFPPVFLPDTTYYWRVDEIDAAGNVYKGDVWSLTTAPAKAYDPVPWDNRKGVEVQTKLTWMPGAGALSHDVYFGTDKAAVKAGDASVFAGNVLPSAYEPETLAANTTYYWRVDERGPGDTVQTGAIWSFKTVGPGIGVKAQYFKGIDLSGAPVLTQIEDSINHNWGSGDVAPGLSDAVSARWRAALEVPFTEAYQLITTTDDGVRLWLDGRLIINNWTNHGSTDDVARVDLVAGQVCLLQMDYYENGGSAVAQLSWQSPSIPRQIIPGGSLLLPVVAMTPYPASGAVNTPQTLMLHWTAGDSATDQDVYFGDNADAVADADTSTTGVYHGRQALNVTKFDPGVLEWGKTYYWRVDEVNAAAADSPWKGSVWSFTTADFLVVDDFESYTNDIGDRVFQTWLDGYGYTEPQTVQGNGTGAVIGHDIWTASSPYYGGAITEIHIIHTGGQSMPMDYNNATAPYYSETERTWTAPQNWTVKGMNTLVLYVRGEATNAPARLYIVVQDGAGHTAVVAHSDPATVSDTQFVEWTIPLTSLTGVNTAAVKKMYIGVGDRSAPKAGGAGTLYIDDIRVIKAE